MQPWPVGPVFSTTEVTIDDQAVDQPVTLQSLAPGEFDLQLEVCGTGGTARFTIIGNELRVRDLIISEDGGCEEQDPDRLAGARRVEALFLGDPTVAIDDTSIRLEGEGVVVELLREGGTTNALPLTLDVRYVGQSTTIDGIDPTTIAIRAPAIFVLEIELESVDVHGQLGELSDQSARDIIAGANEAECPDPTTSDQLTLDLLNAQPTISRDGEGIVISGDLGSLSLVPS